MNILIVDDTKLNRMFAAKIINNSNIGLTIFYASSGEEALEVINQEAIHIVLLDIIMPGIDGIQTLREIKSNEETADIKVIMYSTITESNLLSECFELGASDFIHKPFERIEFISRLRNTIKQKKLEDDTAEYIKEIKAQKTMISDANIQLMQQEKMAGIGQLAAGVAHEINNPLGFVASNISVLEEYMKKFYILYHLFIDPSKEDKELLETVHQYIEDEDFLDIFEDLSDLFDETMVGLKRVKDIVKSLQNFSRIDADEDFDTYNLNEGLKDTLMIANNNIKYNANVHVNYGKLPEVNALGGQLNQVLLNLIMNAVDAIKERYGDSKGDLFIETFVEGESIVTTVTDTGTGISDENLKKLFNPFFTTKEIGKGLGLGLSVSYDIVVNKHQGKLAVRSILGEGTEFKLYIPIERQISQ